MKSVVYMSKTGTGSLHRLLSQSGAMEERQLAALDAVPAAELCVLKRRLNVRRCGLGPQEHLISVSYRSLI